MLTEHSVTYGDPNGGHTVITRSIYAPGRSDRDRRILGTETTTEKWFEGEWSGWHFRESCTDTREFGHLSEAQAWMDEMHRAWEVHHVQKRLRVASGAGPT